MADMYESPAEDATRGGANAPKPRTRETQAQRAADRNALGSWLIAASLGVAVLIGSSFSTP